MSKIIKILSLTVIIHQSLLAGFSLPNPFAKKKQASPTEVSVPNPTKASTVLPSSGAKGIEAQDKNLIKKHLAEETDSETSEMGQSVGADSQDEENLEPEDPLSAPEEVNAVPASAKRPFLVHRDGGVDPDEWEEQMNIVKLLEKRGELIRREAFFRPYTETLYDLSIYSKIEADLDKNRQVLTPMLAPFDIPANFLRTLDDKNTQIANLLIERASIESKNPNSFSPDHLNESQIKVKLLENLREIEEIQQSTHRSASGPLISVHPDEDIQHYKQIIKDAQVIDGTTDFDDEGRAYMKDNKTGYKVTKDRSGKLIFTDLATDKIMPRS
ncbi:MAG TPA: hypothetical protein DIC42_06880 [Holosporales bacterium]|nr:hypothetical protein [Holosporales bacterium]